MRKVLSKNKLRDINDKLPNIDKRFHLATSQGPGIDFNDLIGGTGLGIALVCLEDAGHRFAQTRLALHEGYACLAWYREESSEAPLETQAVFTGKFYADYAALLLYAAGEDIAAFIVAFLGIEAELKQYLEDPENVSKLNEKRISSNAAKVGVFMADQRPDHEITKIILDLHKNPSWREAMEYRNVWVHEKPPLIKGAGIQYDRNSRVIKTKMGSFMGFGGGSEPKYTVDELLNVTLLATVALAKTLSNLVDLVIKRREELGETLDFDSGKVSVHLSFGTDPQ